MLFPGYQVPIGSSNKVLRMALRIPIPRTGFGIKDIHQQGSKKPSVPVNKEPHWVLQNWDDIMACMICRTYLEREVHSAGDLLDLVQKGIGSYLQTLRNKGKGSGEEAKTCNGMTYHER